MFKIALLGAGRIGRIHAANAAAHPALSLQYVVDPVAQAAQSLALAHGATVTDVEKVLADPAIAGVIVASSTDTHLDYARRAAAAGKAVFCEKPLDLSLARAQQARADFAKSGARLFLGFNRRFDPNFAALKERIANRTAGKLESLHITSHDPAPPPVSYIKVSGGLFKDMAIHDFDMARWLLDEEPSMVFASASCLVDPEIGKAGDIDTAKIVLMTPSGKICTISNSRRSGYGYDQRIEAFCSEGLLAAGNERESTVQTWTEDGAASDRFRNFFLERYADAYRQEMNHFAAILAGEVKPSVGYEDGVAALALAEAANESLKSGKAVAL